MSNLDANLPAGIAAFKRCREAAERGDPNEQLKLALRYSYGDGTPRDAQKSSYWYRLAAEGGSAQAQCEMGRRPIENRTVAENEAASANWFFKAAMQGYPEGQNLYGRCLFYGTGVKEDRASAINWVQNSIDQEYSPGWSSLEDFYRVGHFELKNAAEMGIKPAQVDFGLSFAVNIHSELDVDKALMWIKQGSHFRDDASVFFDLGLRFLDGRGVDRDLEKSADYFQRAVELGHERARQRLSLCFAAGKGVEKSMRQAIDLYREWNGENWEISSTDAAYRIGERFSSGDGLPNSEVEAFNYFLEAAEAGHSRAKNNLAVAYLYGKGVAKSESQAIRWFQAAAKEGIMEAQANLGNCYSEGNGVRQNDEEAVQWYRKAAAQNYDEAEYCLGECYELGLGVDVDLEQAVGLYEKASLHGSEKARSKLKEIAKRHHSIAKTTSDEIIHKFACEACSNKYYYQQLVRKEERKSSGTDYCSKLDKVIPCPSCGHIQNCMIDLSRDQHLNWLHRLGSFMLLFGLLFLLFTLASSLVFIAFFDWVFASETGRFLLSLTIIIGVLGSGFATAGEIILRVKGAQSEDYDPNKTTSRRDLKWPMIWMAISVAFVALVVGRTSSHLYDRTGSSIYADVSTVSAAAFVIALVAWSILSLKKAK